MTNGTAEAAARERLVRLAGDKGVSLAALSAMIGRNPTYLQQFVRKGSPRRLEERDRHVLAQFFGVPEGELGAPDFARGKVAPVGRARGGGAAWVDVPRLPLGASAGPGAFAAGEVPEGQLRFSARWLSRNGFAAANLSVIAVEGDSMEPTLRDGDEILVDRGAVPLRAGIHVIRFDDVLLVKRLELAGPGTVRVISDNPAYARAEHPVDAVEVVGRVVWKGGRL
ncbi:MAG: transcriptional regulator [Sphingomonadales bacterium]|nr:transcriptional regulator [Sphingomonadales bacterium]MDE2569651.1 transcriptional regulator [Sphingomonadales bacterium]